MSLLGSSGARTIRQSVVWLALCAALPAADLPRKAPDFAIHVPGSPDLHLSQYRGKIVALAFIHTTCPHCQNFTRILTAIQKEYGPRGVQVLECAYNQGAQQLVPAFQQQFQPNFPVGWSDYPEVFTFMQISILRPGYVPKLVFIDRDGTIRKQFEGEDNFFQDGDKNARAALDDMLKTTTGARRAVKSSTKK